VLDEELFHCFVSRANVGGKTVRVAVEASKRLKFEAVFRGFTTKTKLPRKNLTAWERIVILMREATSADDFNHEWWATRICRARTQLAFAAFGSVKRVSNEGP